MVEYERVLGLSPRCRGVSRVSQKGEARLMARRGKRAGSLFMRRVLMEDLKEECCVCGPCRQLYASLYTERAYAPCPGQGSISSKIAGIAKARISGSGFRNRLSSMTIMHIAMTWRSDAFEACVAVLRPQDTLQLRTASPFSHHRRIGTRIDKPATVQERCHHLQQDNATSARSKPQEVSHGHPQLEAKSEELPNHPSSNHCSTSSSQRQSS